MKILLKNLMLWMSLSATVLLGADDEDRGEERPEHPENFESSKPTQKAPRFSSAEEVRERYQQAFEIFQEIINGNLALGSEVFLIEQVKSLINLRLELYRLLVNDTQVPQMRAAYLGALLIDLQRIIREASEIYQSTMQCEKGMQVPQMHPVRLLTKFLFNKLPSVALGENSLQDFVNQIFLGIECQYRSNDSLDSVVDILLNLGYVETAAVGELRQIRGLNSFQKLVDELQQIVNDGIHNLLPQKNCIFWRTLLRETRSMEAFLDRIRQRDNYGNTPLHSAFWHGQVDIIERVYQLVGRDAFLALMQERRNNGNTPFDSAFWRGQVDIIERVYQLVGRDAFLALMQKRDEYGNIPLHRAFRFDHINVIDAVCKLVGRDAFLDVLQKCNNYGNTPLHDVCCNGQVNVQVNVIDAVYELVGRDAFLALIEERNKHGNTPLHEAALFKKKAIFVWLLERCKGDEDFKLKLRELVQSLKTQLASEDPGTQAAIMELLEFLNSDPDEGCNVSQYSSSDDDDDDAGSGGSNGKNESNRPVIHVDCSHLFNTQENGGDSGGGCDSGSNNQSQESSSSKKAAYSLMSSFKLNPPGVEGDAGIRSVMGY